MSICRRRVPAAYLSRTPRPSFGTRGLASWNLTAASHLTVEEDIMAVNKPVGDNARKGAVKKRTQLKNPLTKTETKRNKKGGQFMAVKKSAKKFKGVRKEK
jgi:hypothetical protein